jgi:hypothetical protein
MSRELRRVPVSWALDPRFPLSLHDGYTAKLAAWELHNSKWNEGLELSYSSYALPVDQWVWVAREGEALQCAQFADWDGPRPKSADFMPDWPDSERTHYVLYETVTEGSPVSPVFATAEELAAWLVTPDGRRESRTNSTYEAWMKVFMGNGHVPSMVFQNGVALDPVAAASGDMVPRA